MHKEEYERLLKRFALELSDVGVSDDLILLVKDGINRHANMSFVGEEEKTDYFEYRHQGYSIEAVRTVKLSVKKCK